MSSIYIYRPQPKTCQSKNTRQLPMTYIIQWTYAIGL
nr:MAG TPA: hypothetical protein [Caudoviricetes sp.]